MTVDEQLAYLTKGCVDVVRAADLRAKLERSAKDGAPLVVKVGFDPTAPDLHLGPHRPDSKDEALSGSGSPRGVRDRRLHRHDRRPDWPVKNASSADNGGNRGERGDVPDAGVQDSGPGEDGC
jgi:hypothetical protein